MLLGRVSAVVVVVVVVVASPLAVGGTDASFDSPRCRGERDRNLVDGKFKSAPFVSFPKACCGS